MPVKTRYWVVENELSLKEKPYVLGKILSRHSKRIRAEISAQKLSRDRFNNALVVIKSQTVRSVGDMCWLKDVIIEDRFKTSLPDVMYALSEAVRQLRGVIFLSSQNKIRRDALMNLYRLLLKLERKFDWQFNSWS